MCSNKPNNGPNDQLLVVSIWQNVDDGLESRVTVVESDIYTFIYMILCGHFSDNKKGEWIFSQAKK